MSQSVNAAAADNCPPRWDVSTIFPSLESSEFATGFEAAIARIHALQELFDREAVRQTGATDVPASSGSTVLIDRLETVLNSYNTVLQQVGTLRAYIESYISTDSRNETAQARMSTLRREMVGLGILGTRLTAWIGGLSIPAFIEASAVARAHGHFLYEAQIAAKHLLSPGEETLAAELNLAGGSAWARLHGDLTSQMMVALDGETRPMSVIRSLASSPDRETRRRAYEAELAAWEQVALPLSAAMNSIKHQANVLSVRRGWNDVLDSSLFHNAIDRDTLDAMLAAARAAFPDFRRYLRAKARIVAGEEQLRWYDLFAPVESRAIGATPRVWPWSAAEAFIEQQFGAYSPKLSAFAARAFRERWVDAEPRPGKRDGAFCMGMRPGESRILQNYKPAFDGISTLAHELGHGYHNLCLAERTPLQRSTPMTLAETASIFCETIVQRAVLSNGDPAETLPILEESLQGQCQVVVDITSRFLFEQRVLARRRDRDLSPQEFCALMTEAQRETYGDGLDEAFLHPYMWAVKGHYYGSSFYNYPYMFGLLFGLGLYSQYERDPEAFRDRYDDLLSRTGMASAADLAAEFGFDLRSEAFWTGGFDIIRHDVDRFEALCQQPNDSREG